MDAAANILSFWRLVEWLTPAAFPKVNPKRDEREPVYDIRPHESLPWEKDHFHNQLRCSTNHSSQASDNPREIWAYGVYAGVLDVSAARHEIESWLDDEVSHVVRDERDPQGTASIGFQVDSDGRVIADSLVVSTFAWGFGVLRSFSATGRPGLAVDALSSDAFESVEQEIQEQFASALSGARLTTANCDAFLHWLFKRLSLPMERLKKHRCRVQCVRRPLNRPKLTAKDEEDDTGTEPATEEASQRLTAALEMLNSHFRDDLARVQNAAAHQDIGAALQRYLGKQTAPQIDIRQEHHEAWSMIAPQQFPKGRWPTKGRFPLVFSQQIAVNQAFRSAGDNGDLMAINGPPGTGKTTLLKEMVAGIIVSRAEVLSQYRSPDQAFDRIQPAWQNGNWNQSFAPIAPELQKFGIVVASSNNGAVENVTLEFPKADDVDPEWGDRQTSPFCAIGSALLPEGEEAWSLMAACLGKSQNRNAFADAFWGWERKSETGHHRIPQLLKGGRPSEVKGWREAVKEFREALRLEKQERDKRQRIYDSATRLGELEQQMRQLQAQEAAVTRQQTKLRSQLEAAKAAHSETEVALNTAHSQAVAKGEQDLGEAQSLLEVREKQYDLARVALQDVEQRLTEHYRRQPGALLRFLSHRVTPLLRVTQWEANREEIVTRVTELSAELDAQQQRNSEALDAVASAQQSLGHAAIQDLTSEARQQHAEAERALSKAESAARTIEKQLAGIKQKCNAAKARYYDAEELVSAYRDQHGRQHCPSLDSFAHSPRDKELSSPWADAQWEAARVEVFRAALDLHDSFAFEAGKPLQHNLRGMVQLLRGKAPRDIPPGVAQTLWASLFLLVPVVSTTFASFARQFEHLGRESIGWLMIDEAGQAAPQQAAGALWRARTALVVGDPMQLTPVVTVPDRLQASLAESVSVSMSWLPSKTSVQSLADHASSHGSFIGETWVGLPLLVHRRCDSPMFEIANAVAYDNAMVMGKPPSDVDLPTSKWVHVPADRSDGHWIPAEGDAVERLISDLLEHGLTPSDMFLISPFRAVVTNLLGIARRFRGIKAGTIHTVQGREAKAVILVLGGNPSQAGAKSWASSTPNLVNVAVSRAKQRLYVVGDRETWARYPYFDECAAQLLSAQHGQPISTDHESTLS